MDWSKVSDEWFRNAAKAEEGHAVSAGGPAMTNVKGMRCHAAQDGECEWRKCPQLRDGEPTKTGRHCPLDVREEERYG